MATGWPTKINFTNGNALPASDLNDLSGTVNSLVDTTNYPNQLSFVSAADSIRRPLPWAIQNGTATTGFMTSNASWSYATLTINLATGRFTQAPLIRVTPVRLSSTIPIVANISAITTTSFDVTVYYATAGTQTVTVHWEAIQLKSGAANG